MPLASVLAQLHTALDRPRRPRPRNRHVVDDDQGVDIEVTARDGQGVLRTIRGKLGNFSVGDDGWKPGAWVTTIEAPWPSGYDLVKELRALLPRDVPVNARGEGERKHFPRAAFDLCFGWFRGA